MQSLLESNKTIFTFTDKTGQTSTFTLNKNTADALPMYVGGNVHAWVQSEYDGIVAGDSHYAKYFDLLGDHKEITRLAIGNIIRYVADDIINSDIDDSEL